jgi:hypothetical protein
VTIGAGIGLAVALLRPRNPRTELQLTAASADNATASLRTNLDPKEQAA